MSVEYGSAFVLVDYFIFYVAFIIITRYAVERVHNCAIFLHLNLPMLI